MSVFHIMASANKYLNFIGSIKTPLRPPGTGGAPGILTSAGIVFSRSAARPERHVVLSILIVTFFMLLHLLPANVAAQEAPKEFYKHDYAKSTYDESAGEKSPRNKSKDKNKINLKNNNSAVGSDSDFKEMKEEHKPEIEEDTSYLDTKGEKVLSVGLLATSDNEEHVFQNLAELMELVNKHDLAYGAIYLVGSNKQILTNPSMVDFFRAAAFRMGKVNYLAKVPEKYAAVKKSPTWIVQTEKGQVLLEALGPLRKNFNRNGQLVK